MRQIEAVTSDLGRSRVFRIAYEDLCDDPAGELARLCDFLGVDFEERMARRNAYESHHIGGSPSKFDAGRVDVVRDSSYEQALGPEESARLRKLVGACASRWGY
jgi:hypothetical protein